MEKQSSGNGPKEQGDKGLPSPTTTTEGLTAEEAQFLLTVLDETSFRSRTVREFVQIVETKLDNLIHG